MERKVETISDGFPTHESVAAPNIIYSWRQYHKSVIGSELEEKCCCPNQYFCENIIAVPKTVKSIWL